MSKAPYTLLIDHIPGETRVALLQDGELRSLEIERIGYAGGDTITEGNIYLGRVVNVVPSLQAAFVDIGCGENGFLPVNATYEEDVSKAVHVGQAVMVQIRKVGQADKGPSLSCKVDLQSTHCVLTPERPGINVSRKFKDSGKRSELSEALSGVMPKDVGLIVRTSAEGITAQTLRTEANDLLNQWNALKASSRTAPCLVKNTTPFLERVWQQHHSLDIEHISIDGINAFHDIKALCPEAEPYSATTALFEAEAVEEQIEAALEKIVSIPNGGTIHIERTSALIAIDVNMGERLDSRNTDDNKLRTNLDALKVIKEQISLRNLSGQILIDFITLKSQSNKDKMRDAVKNVFTKDIRATVHGFTRLGLCEMSRTRQGYALDELQGAPEAVFFKLIRHLSRQSGQKSLTLGRHLYSLWHSERFKLSTDWLSSRLGYGISIQEDTNLPSSGFQILEV